MANDAKWSCDTWKGDISGTDSRSGQVHCWRGTDERKIEMKWYKKIPLWEGWSDVGKWGLHHLQGNSLKSCQTHIHVRWTWGLIEDNHVKRSRVSYSDGTESKWKKWYEWHRRNKQFPLRGDEQTWAAMASSLNRGSKAVRWGECSRCRRVLPSDLCPRESNKM